MKCTVYRNVCVNKNAGKSAMLELINVQIMKQSSWNDGEK